MCYKGQVSLQTQNRLIGIFFLLPGFQFFFLIGIGFGDRVIESTRVQQVYIYERKKILKECNDGI